MAIKICCKGTFDLHARPVESENLLINLLWLVVQFVWNKFNITVLFSFLNVFFKTMNMLKKYVKWKYSFIILRRFNFLILTIEEKQTRQQIQLIWKKLFLGKEPQFPNRWRHLWPRCTDYICSPQRQCNQTQYLLIYKIINLIIKFTVFLVHRSVINTIGIVCMSIMFITNAKIKF